MKRCQEPGTDFKNMKKLFFSIAALALAASSNAQQVTAPEPEFIGSYCMLTSDSTYVVLPKENGKVEKHQNKFSKFSKIAGAVSDLGFAGGMVGLSTGSMAGLETGVRVMGAQEAVQWGNKNSTPVYAIEVDAEGKQVATYSRAFEPYLKCVVNQNIATAAPPAQGSH